MHHILLSAYYFYKYIFIGVLPSGISSGSMPEKRSIPD